MIVSILSIVIIVFLYTKSFIKIKKNVSLTWEMKKGIICYSCKEKVSDHEDDWSYNFDMSKEDFKLCTSCERDEKLGELIYKSDNHKWTNRLKKYLVSNRSNKMMFIYIGALFLFFTIDLLLHINGFKNSHIFSIASPILNILYASLFYYKVCITSGDEKATFKE
jgi:hypothetical protein